jgi:dTMP kinase
VTQDNPVRGGALEPRAPRPSRASGRAEIQGGLFITFEGGEGSGKSTQAELLSLHLDAGGWPVLRLREPGGTPLGEELRRLLLHRRDQMTPETELLLFLAARAELVRRVIRPALDAGGIVICDRFADSTLAYQGYGRGLDIEKLKTLNQVATGGLEPALTVLLDLPVAVGRQRKSRDEDAFQREDDAFHERVRQGYLALSKEDSKRWLVLDAMRERDELAKEIAIRVAELAPPSSIRAS